GQGGPPPRRGGTSRRRTPDLADDARIAASPAQGAEGHVRTGGRGRPRLVGGPGDAPRTPRDEGEGTGGKGPRGSRVGHSEQGRAGSPRNGGPGSVASR